MPGVPRVVLGQDVCRNPLQHLLGEDSEQLPSDVQGLEDGSVLVTALSDEVLLELSEEFQVEEIIRRESFLADDSLHGLHVLADGVAGVQLVGDVGVILAGHALADGGLHETGQRGKYVDGREDLPVVHLTVDVDLPLGDVAGQVRDGVSDVVVWHRQDGDLSDRPVAALHTACSLVDGGQVSVHVAGETTSAGHLLSGSGDLTQGLGIRGHVSQDDQHVLLALVSEKLGGREGQPGRDDSLDGWVVGQVQEEADVFH